MKLLWQESKIVLVYENNIIQHDAPNKILINNAKVLIGDKLKDVSCKNTIITDNTVLYYQYQNLTEGKDGNYKFAVN